MLPVLITSVQELSNENGELKKKNEEQEQRLQRLEALLTKNNNATSVNVSSAYPEQNAPNPARTTSG